MKEYVEIEEKKSIQENDDVEIKRKITCPLSNFIYGKVYREDDRNEPQVNIEVLKRYAIENYIYDFIYVFFYLKTKIFAKFKQFVVDKIF